MSKTRISLYYLASYLLFGGLGFLIVPKVMLNLFMSNGNYSDVMVRLVGLMLLSLGIVIIQIIRLDLEQLYTTTLFIRSIIIVILLTFYFVYNDPLYLVLFIVVGLGFLFTLTSYFFDRRKNIKN
jgi:uncharacterized protein YjeT (DUF2065 family)